MSIGGSDLVKWNASGENVNTILPLTGSSVGIGAAPGTTATLDVGTLTGATSAKFGPTSSTGVAGPIYMISGSGNSRIAFNAYYNGTNWIYATTGVAGIVGSTANGGVEFYSAPSGTAGATATFARRGVIDASGLTIGATGTPISASYRGAANIAPGNIPANLCGTMTITTTGAVVGAECAVSVPSNMSNVSVTCGILAPDVCTLWFCNPATVGIVAPTGNYSCRALNP
jgi:hypothetical protein